ncbi:MAG: hypothetical protein AAFY41_18230, partial [Bacteroidota bacterium]
MKTIQSLLLPISISLIVACTSQQTENKPMRPDAPVANKADTILKEHGQSRLDPYFWMRLTDEQKTAENPDEQTKEVLAYLGSENDYTKKVMSHTEQLQDKLYDEIVGRIKQTDESVPYISNGYWYYTRYEEGGEYPIYCRKKESLDNEEEILINVNELAEGYGYYSAFPSGISQDNKILAFAEDTLSEWYKFFCLV